MTLKRYEGTTDCCRFCPNYSDDGYCCAEDKRIEDSDKLPKWCPLEDA
jgi:hypothetical protein